MYVSVDGPFWVVFIYCLHFRLNAAQPIVDCFLPWSCCCFVRGLWAVFIVPFVVAVAARPSFHALYNCISTSPYLHLSRRLHHDTRTPLTFHRRNEVHFRMAPERVRLQRNRVLVAKEG